MKWFVRQPADQIAFEADVPVVEVRVQKSVMPVEGDRVVLVAEGTVRRVLGDEIEVVELKVTKILEVSRESR